jgi:hypothetical protein
MRKLVSILLLLFVLANLGESKIVATGTMSSLTQNFQKNVADSEQKKEDPRIKAMQSSIKIFGEITFNSMNFNEEVREGVRVDLHVIPIKKILKHCSSVESLRSHERYAYLSAVWEQNKELFEDTNKKDWPYTVGGKNYARNLTVTFENVKFLEKKKKIDTGKAQEFLWGLFSRSHSTDVKEKNDAEKELNGLHHSANGFGGLVKSIRKNGFRLTEPVVLMDNGRTVDGSHRLIATLFLIDKGLLPEGSFFSFVKVHREKTPTVLLEGNEKNDL